MAVQTPEEPCLTELLVRLMDEVKPYGGVWSDAGQLSIRYLPFRNPIRISWADAALLVGLELNMKPSIKAAIAAAPPKRLIVRKPMAREKIRSLTLEQIKEAKREAREWGEARGEYTRGFGAQQLA